MANVAPRRSAVRRTSTVKQIPKAEAQRKVLDLISQGLIVKDAMHAVGRSEETYRDWQKNDDAFKTELAKIREGLAEPRVAGAQPVPDFPEFCRDYLGEPLFEHQLRAWDVLNSRPPRHMHPAITYEAGDEGRMLFNFPPNHAKTVSFSMNYATWLIHKNPGISIAIISKSQGYSKKILNGIKARLTSNKYREMHMRFAPVGPDGERGWRDKDQSWSATQIYVQGKYEDGETEKEPTIEAVGIGGHIYGGRFDVIICDDVIDKDNVQHYDDQIDWLMTILDSRLPPDGGLMMLLGTRMGATDLYGELRKTKDEDDNQFFTYLAQPAVLDYGEGPADTWLPLWPWTNKRLRKTDESETRCAHCYAPEGTCECGDTRYEPLYPRWTGKRLAKKRFPLGERRWALVWQQQEIPDDATFPQWAVQYSVNRQRRAGLMRGEAMGHRQSGMNGLYVVGGLDPATVGCTAIVVSALERSNEKRWVLDGFNKAGTSPATMRERIKFYTDLYHINEWVIERNAFQKFLTDDPELRSFLQSRGCKLTPHFTNENKVDPDFGVMSMATLFESCGEPPSNGGGGKMRRKPFTECLIELPDDTSSGIISELVKQLIVWEPSGMTQSTKTDLVMALWFTEIAFKRILSRSRDIPTHLNNPFLSKARARGRAVINLAELREAQIAEREVA